MAFIKSHPFPLALFVFLWAVLPCLSTPVRYQAGDEDVVIFNERYPSDVMVDYSTLVSGDYNGDGQSDLAIMLISQIDYSWEVNLFLGGSLPRESTITNEADLRVLFPAHGLFSSAVALADVNADGKKDLAIGTWVTGPDSPGQVSIVFGSTDIPKTIDLAKTDPDVKIIGEQSGYLGLAFAQGDFDEDGKEDLFLGGRNRSYLLAGRSGLAKGTTLNLSTDRLPTFIFNLFDPTAMAMMGYDVDGDTKDDLIVPIGNNIGVIYGPIVKSLADIQVVQPPKTIYNGAVGDLTGDGKPEMLMGSLPSVFLPIKVIDGNTLRSGQAVVDVSLPTTPIATAILPQHPRAFFNSAIGDFDGDGKNDLFLTGNLGSLRAIPYLFAYLSSERGGAGLQLDPIQTPTFIWDRPFDTIRLVDLNGDGLKDLVGYDKLSTLPPYGAIRIMYGYQLLLDPHIAVEPKQPTSTHVKLTLSVGGDPTEMRISGDIVDPFKDQWIPYKQNLAVVLTSNKGSKTVQATFRNSTKRESATVQDLVALSVGSQSITVHTNRVKGGGRSSLDCSLTSPGQIHATVYNGLGNKVVDLIDGEFGVGIWPVEWDGRNTQGDLVAPGYYDLVVVANGQQTKTKILVQK